MRRPVAVTATVLAAGLIALAGVPGSSENDLPADTAAHALTGVWRPAGDERSCKPRGPVAVELSSRRRGERVELAFRIEPQLALEEVTWTLQLPAGAVLTDGTLTDHADPDRHAVSRGQATVLLPPSHAAGELALLVTGRLAGTESVFTVERQLPELGQAPVVGTRRELPAPHGRARVTVQAVPTLHRAGR